jgi:8-oxo-dGTP pyrophosphatase MutT (NUDIX family)
MSELTHRIQTMLAELQPRKLAGGFDREAAVLMLFFERAAQPHFLLTLRTDEVSTHKGQISFPGGMRQGAETLEQTALRETDEEIGIPPERMRILGRFHDYLSITGHRVAPFAATVEEPFATIAQAGEVAEVLQVPWSVFADPARLRVETMLRHGSLIDVYFYRYGAHEIWGLTARMIKDFFDALAGKHIPHETLSKL